VRRLRSDERSRDVTDRALVELARLFGGPRGRGSTLAAQAAAPFEREETIMASAVALTDDLLAATKA
jgi:hypothetical protein